MKVLIVGSGGREHALAWKVAQSPQVNNVYVAPGNAGTKLEDNIENIPLDVLDIQGLINFVKEQGVDLTIIGPEAPLAAGIVDEFTAQDLACFGPTQGAAQLESSKAYSKQFMQKYKIPTAEYASFSELNAAINYIKTKGAPIVIKADGLAAGKGVTCAQTEQEAIQAVTEILDEKVFGQAGSKVVIEEFLTGEEASFILMTDGKHILPFASSQDHKARDNGDLGPNTGGMGAYSPAPVITPEIHEKIMQDVVKPTIDGLAKEGHPFTGFLYVGLMIANDGSAKVLEYNCRMGDPETQPIMLRLKSDLSELCLAAVHGKLSEKTIEFDQRAALGVVLCSDGYPEKYAKGKVISGLKHDATLDQKIFHAGTTTNNGDVVTNGGRVLCATSLGNSVTQAQKLTYELLQQIQFDGVFYRTDIGYRAIAREQR